MRGRKKKSVAQPAAPVEEPTKGAESPPEEEPQELDLEEPEETEEGMDIHPDLAGAILHGETMARYGHSVYLVDAVMALDRLVTSTKIRKTHLEKAGKSDPYGGRVISDVLDIKKWVLNEIATLLKEHPAHPWFSQIRGIGPENIAKVIGLVERFGRYFRQCEQGHTWKKEDEPKGRRNLCPTCGGEVKEEIFRRGIERLNSISAFYKHSGWGNEKEADGNGNEVWVSQRRKAGEKIGYNNRLKTALWKVGASLLKQTGEPKRKRQCLDGHTWKKADEKEEFICPQCGKAGITVGGGSTPGTFRLQYLRFKDAEIKKARDAGLRITSSPGKICPECEKEFLETDEGPVRQSCPDCHVKLTAIVSRLCPQCGYEGRKKDTKFCPSCGTKLGSGKEVVGTISAGHIHARAMRKMIKLWIAQFWLVWRAAEGLPATSPYAISVLGHQDFIDPWTMCDKIKKKKE